ncbi:helix-turn-helix transcriptional regulator [Novosphingobium mangrovi (ex Huang et al. 2023)]|uniref:Helix-turn-helix transcriptional regulator n=1 Tax=Novosphingobium mangrovi (ex Huang et al. 2023) TaxID=2976432 RepID=A0ABT2I3E3_9SPHN|nr:helix-turn-helix transcriptional regulator [Novosphingobium mangrovi (ex Huang et al. 2023)]MCT2399330.1 helix-turn-helix transcriptional regulator [Novosphingobium mangrovi (ex Huang et al. 2023)]
MSADDEALRARPGEAAGGDDQYGRLLRAFSRLTAKQHEVLRYVSENRTSKEIAWELGISESAVNQRIEAVRGRTGSPPRAELARAYRQYLQDLEEACKPVPDKIPQVPDRLPIAQPQPQDGPAEQLALADAVHFTLTPPWQGEVIGRVGPEVLDGPHAGLSRTAAMVVIAGGMLLVAMVGLGVVDALSKLF